MSEMPLVVIEGGEGVERARRLLHAMVNADLDMTEFGTVLMQLIQVDEQEYAVRASEIMQGYIRQFALPADKSDDPSFDQKLVIEALNYASRCVRREWDRARHPFSPTQYVFRRWLRNDLLLAPA